MPDPCRCGHPALAHFPYGDLSAYMDPSAGWPCKQCRCRNYRPEPALFAALDASATD